MKCPNFNFTYIKSFDGWRGGDTVCPMRNHKYGTFSFWATTVCFQVYSRWAKVAPLLLNFGSFFAKWPPVCFKKMQLKKLWHIFCHKYIDYASRASNFFKVYSFLVRQIEFFRQFFFLVLHVQKSQKSCRAGS